MACLLETWVNPEVLLLLLDPGLSWEYLEYREGEGGWRLEGLRNVLHKILEFDHRRVLIAVIVSM